MTEFAGIMCSQGSRFVHTEVESWRAALTDLWADLAPNLPRATVERAGSTYFGRIECGDAKNSTPRTAITVRLDNAQAVRRSLAPELDRPISQSDAKLSEGELVELLLTQAGIAGLTRVVGSFALAHRLDGTGGLILARDALGTRPLYYSQPTPNTLYYATQLRALLTIVPATAELDEDVLVRFLARDGSGPDDRTSYTQIRSVPSGCALHIHPDGVVERHRHWQLRANDRAANSVRPERITEGTPDAASQLRALMTEAVTARLRDANRPAIQLSGGLDSSALAVLAARHLAREGRRLLAFCSRLPKQHAGPEQDEHKFAQAVADQEPNIDLHWVELGTESTIFAELDRIFELLAEPPLSAVTHAESALGRAAQAFGVDTVLSGFGGDFFASWRGATVLRELLRDGHWRTALGEFRGLCRSQAQPWWRIARRELLQPLFRTLRPRGRRARNHNCLRQDVVHRFGQRQGQALLSSSEQLSQVSPAAMMEFIAAPGHIERVLVQLHTRFRVDHGQDLRFPLLDRRIVEFMHQLPAVELQRGGCPRSLFRRAMRGILPEEVRRRREKGPAFDPALMSRLEDARDALDRWALTDEGPAWHLIDRTTYLSAVRSVRAGRREQWSAEAFDTIINGGQIARFLQWHHRRFGSTKTAEQTPPATSETCAAPTRRPPVRP